MNNLGDDFRSRSTSDSSAIMLTAPIGTHAKDRAFLVSVRNETVKHRSRTQDGDVGQKKTKKGFRRATRVSVEKEMDQPRMSRSAKIAELDLDIARIREEPSTSMRGTVREIIPPERASQSEKAQISVGTADKKYRELRIENTLINEHGDDVKLKGCSSGCHHHDPPRKSSRINRENRDARPARSHTA